MVTWDHFFKSLEQYLWNLQEQLEGVKGEQLSIPNITQPELDALDAVLTLTTHIITLVSSKFNHIMIMSFKDL